MQIVTNIIFSSLDYEVRNNHTQKRLLRTGFTYQSRMFSPLLARVKHCDLHLKQTNNREFKKLRRQLKRKRDLKIELCVKLSLLRLFHVGQLVQNRPSALLLAWQEWFSCKGKERKIYCSELESKPRKGI